MLRKDEPRCPRSLRVCYTRRSPDQEEEEGQVPDLVKWQAPTSDETILDRRPSILHQDTKLKNVSVES